MNLAVFKLLQYLSPFLDYKEEKLADFFKFVSKFYWNSLEHPSRIYRCGSFLERYLQPVMQAVIFLEEGDRLAAIKLATVSNRFYVRYNSFHIDRNCGGRLFRDIARKISIII